MAGGLRKPKPGAAHPIKLLAASEVTLVWHMPWACPSLLLPSCAGACMHLSLYHIVAKHCFSAAGVFMFFVRPILCCLVLTARLLIIDSYAFPCNLDCKLAWSAVVPPDRRKSAEPHRDELHFLCMWAGKKCLGSL